jgi:hypothetical protein
MHEVLRTESGHRIVPDILWVLQFATALLLHWTRPDRAMELPALTSSLDVSRVVVSASPHQDAMMQKCPRLVRR